MLQSRLACFLSVLLMGTLALSCGCNMGQNGEVKAVESPQDPLIREVETLLAEEAMQQAVEVEGEKGTVNSPIWRAYQQLHQAPEDKDAVITGWIEKNNERLPSLFLAELIRRRQTSDPASASKWRNVALIRSGYDAKRCIDQSATPPESVHRWLTPALDEDQTTPEALFALAEAMDWDRRQNYHATPLWLCIQGPLVKELSGFNTLASPVSVPMEKLVYHEAQWPMAREHNYRDFKELLIRLRQSYQSKVDARAQWSPLGDDPMVGSYAIDESRITRDKGHIHYWTQVKFNRYGVKLHLRDFGDEVINHTTKIYALNDMDCTDQTNLIRQIDFLNKQNSLFYSRNTASLFQYEPVLPGSVEYKIYQRLCLSKAPAPEKQATNQAG